MIENAWPGWSVAESGNIAGFPRVMALLYAGEPVSRLLAVLPGAPDGAQRKFSCRRVQWRHERRESNAAVARDALQKGGHLALEHWGFYGMCTGIQRNDFEGGQ